MQRLNIFTQLLASTSLSLLNSLSWGLPGDREQPITIQSDSAEQRIVNGKETTIYNGSVVMVQGSLHIKGEAVTVFSENRSVTKIVAVGELAFFSQQNSPEKPPVEAQAKTIEYQISTDTIVFLDQATLTQGASSISGQRIDYNTGTAQVKASGGNDVSDNTSASSTGRVNMVLEPKRKTDNAEPAADNGPALDGDTAAQPAAATAVKPDPAASPEPEPTADNSPALDGDTAAQPAAATAVKPDPAASAEPEPAPASNPAQDVDAAAQPATDAAVTPQQAPEPVLEAEETETDIKDAHADAISQ